MNALQLFRLPLLLLLLFGKVQSNRDSTLNMFSKFRPLDVLLDSNSERVLNGTEKDDDYMELGVISLQNFIS